MSLIDELSLARETARKAHNEAQLSTIQMAIAALKNERISLGHELSREEEEGVIGRQVKQLRESLSDFAKGGREDLVTKTQAEIELLESYLPAQLTDEELTNVLSNVIAATGATGPADVGKVMGAAMKEVKGKADGTRVRTLALKLLGNN